MPKSPPLVSLTLCLLVIFPAGCGSKINEANYYRVQHGMDEADVDELLGPAKTESFAESPATTPAASQPVGRKVKTWTRGGLTLSVVFEDGKVVSRSATGSHSTVGAGASNPS
jgi:hypothetical protein